MSAGKAGEKTDTGDADGNIVFVSSYDMVNEGKLKIIC